MDLVLACAEWSGEESDAFPTRRFLERLHQRNSYLIDSHYPLRDALIRDTGRTAQERWSFLRALREQRQVWPPRSWDGRPAAEHLG
ncbi:hypothetical protein GCM10008959_13290 [Deinococcus seoulensis]|uniref:Transposase n=1 Tax=Deinococcus seoulensis TaxID=1837379 RepID=A0ABQ2RNS4_9DEIO|nr:hypothetical protein [Deinococcus seoulensis]GGR53156.1 hypothetical protein GCM10008959_13290 [Deinococcus seoulensis]